MFSGIIETTGTIHEDIPPCPKGCASVYGPIFPSQEISPGESICTNGACLTVTAIEADQLSFDVSAESLRRTTLEHFKLAMV